MHICHRDFTSGPTYSHWNGEAFLSQVQPLPTLTAALLTFSETLSPRLGGANERETEDWGDRLEAMIDAAMLRTDPSATLNRVSTLQGKTRE